MPSCRPIAPRRRSKSSRPCRPPLAPLERRRALLKEGADTLDEVLGLASELLGLAVGVQLAGPVGVEAVPDELADQPQGRRTARQLLSDRGGRADQFVVRHAA